MKRSASGFTIVELLIVIVVIAILATISVVAYNGIQKRANNTARFQEITAWQKSFELYRAQEGHYPLLADGGYCLGFGFPIGGGGVARCRDYQLTGASSYQESGNATLMNELKKVGSLPSGPRKAANGTVGPYTEYLNSSTIVRLMMVIDGEQTDCPSATNFVWTDNLRTLCAIDLYQ